MTDQIVTELDGDEDLELTERERVRLGLSPARKVERDEDGEPTAAEYARLIRARS